MSTRDKSWQNRARCAHALMAGCYAHAVGSLQGAEPRLAAALRDVLANPGSLVRAVAAFLSGLAMGMSEEAARSLACGIEYLHTASLILDDLPSMDDARVRRGVPCIHIKHGEAVATLAAMALINRGYSLLWTAVNRAPAGRRLAAMNWIDSKLGVNGLVGGQAWDLRGWSGDQTPAQVSAIAARKTADLLRLTLVLPAIAGQGSRREIQLLDRLALLRGLAYQAADDLKDVFSHEQSSGKSAGRDQAMGRPNLVAAGGLAAAFARYTRLTALADRVQDLLPGGAARWNMLDMLRVALPAQTRCAQGHLNAAG